MNNQTKHCWMCDKDKDKSEFCWKNKKLGKVGSTCKVCQRLKSKQDYEKNKQYFVQNAKQRKKVHSKINKENLFAYLQNCQCIDCGEKDILVLEFDHKDRKTKKYDISKMVTTYTWASIAKEITKCEIRCANCHRRKTLKENEGWRVILSKLN